MKVLIECRSIFPTLSCGIENFLFSLVRGLAIACPDDEISLNIPPGTRSLYEYYIPHEQIIFVEDPILTKYQSVRRRIPFARYPVGILRRIHPTLTRWFEGPRKGWIHQCEADVDVVLYPFQRDALVHFNRPCVYVMHDFYDFEYPGRDAGLMKLETENIVRANAIVTSWPGPFTTLRSLFPGRSDSSFMIPFSVDNPVNIQGSSEPNHNRVLIYPASTGKHKNHENLIRALGILKRNQAEKVKILCPGTQIPEQMLLLERLVKEEGVNEWIEFLGYIDRPTLLHLYRDSAAVVAPTRYEAFSGATYEGLLHGKPIACSRITPISSLIDRLGVRVCYFDPESPREIAFAIVEVLENAEPYRAASIAARKILTRITWEDTAIQYKEILAWVCGKGPKPGWYPFRSFEK